MANFIQNLIELQEKDSGIDSLAARVAAIPAEIENMQKEIESLNAEVKEKESEYKNKAVAQQNLETDILKLEEEIKKSQGELYAVKTNDMYKTILDGIKDKKNKVSDMETALLKSMDDVAAEKKALDELKENVAKQITGINSKCKELDSEKENLTGEISLKKSSRDEQVQGMLSDSVLAKALARYERIRKSKGGLAVVKVKEGNACGGCNMALTKQQIIEVASADIVVCENCGRMLCADEKQGNS